MKKLIFILLLLLSVGAMAQTMDTTLVVDAQGDTVGLIHTKGETPYFSEEYSLVTDSVGVYRWEVAKGIAGGILEAAGGCILLPAGIYGTYTILSWLGSGSVGGGYAIGLGAFIIPGLVLTAGVAVLGGELFVVSINSFVSAHKNRIKLKKYREKQNDLAVSFVPVIDPVNKVMGANLAFNF